MVDRARLRVFVSSRMAELAPERRALRLALADLHVDAWLFEDDAGARPENIEQTFLEEVAAADLYLGVFWKGYGAYTIEEYEHARRRGTPCLVYEKRVDLGARDPRLQSFLDDIGHVTGAVTIGRFETPSELAADVARDVATWQVTVVRARHRLREARTSWETYLDAVLQASQAPTYGALAVSGDARPAQDPYVPLMAVRCAAGKPLYRAEPMAVSSAVHQSPTPHLVLLGEAGSGKSTLLRHIAARAWTAPETVGLDRPYLPLYAPLRLIAQATGSLEERLRFAISQTIVTTEPLPEAFFVDWTRAADAPWILLLDGLDEVSPHSRVQLRPFLKALMQDGVRHRVLITSRPNGLPDDALPEATAAQFALRPLDATGVRAFARRWLGQDGASLVTAVQGIRAGDLGQTPLVLTIAAILYQTRMAVPARRAALYERIVAVALDEAQQRGLGDELGARLDGLVDLLSGRLQHLALRMIGSSTNMTMASAGDIVGEYLQQEEGFTRTQARAYGKVFIDAMTRRSGLLVARGDVPEFVHPTVRDYLAAAALVTQGTDAWSVEGQELLDRRSDPIWADVVRFLLGVASERDQDVTAAVERMWTADREDLFVLHVLAEDPRISAELDAAITDHFVQFAMFLRQDDFGLVNTIIDALGGLRRRENVADALLALACDGFAGLTVCRHAVDALQALGRVDHLAAILRADAARVRTRVRAASAIADLEPQRLIDLAHDGTIDNWSRVEAAAASSKAGNGDAVVDVLLAVGRDDHAHWASRWNVAAALEEAEHFQDALPIWRGIAGDQSADPGAREKAREAAARLEARVDREPNATDATQT